MGILLRQSFWSTIVIYFGVVLGFINSIILFPSFLNTEQIGLVRQIISASTLLIPITTFGVNSVFVKFYPFFKDSSSGKKEFFSFNFFIVIVSYTITSFLLYIFFDQIKFVFTQKSNLFIDYFYVVYYIIFILSISTLFESYLRARYDTVMSNIVNGVSNRFLTAITILLLSQSIIDFNDLVNLQVAIYSFGLLILLYHSNKKDSISFTFKFPRLNETFTINELNEYISLQQLRGADDINLYKIEKYMRIAQPFTVILLVILGVVIASRKSRQGKGYLIALGFSFAFAFIISFVMSRAFAENGSLSPLIAIWLPNIIFGIITSYMYKLTPK